MHRRGDDKFIYKGKIKITKFYIKVNNIIYIYIYICELINMFFLPTTKSF
jgi:hypothetical protein